MEPIGYWAMTATEERCQVMSTANVCLQHSKAMCFRSGLAVDFQRCPTDLTVLHTPSADCRLQMLRSAEA